MSAYKVLWTWGLQPETRKHSDGSPYPCAEFRWALIVSGERGDGDEDELGEGWASIEIAHQYRYRDEEKWNTSHTTTYGVNVRRKRWRFGVEHQYYDGPHCARFVGPICFFWGGDPRTGWCNKCMPDD